MQCSVQLTINNYSCKMYNNFARTTLCDKTNNNNTLLQRTLNKNISYNTAHHAVLDNDSSTVLVQCY